MSLRHKIINKIRSLYYFKFFIPIYLPLRISYLRRQRFITVVFQLESLGAWKTESLYKAMLGHPRFKPLLVLVESREDSQGKEELKQYCIQNEYEFTEINQNQTAWDVCSPDIFFAQKPYWVNMKKSRFMKVHYKTLCCYVPYGSRCTLEPWANNLEYLRNCWQVYYENDIVAREHSSLLDASFANTYVTSIPAFDDLMISKEYINNPWRNQNTKKKRIIYAPHHSINPENWWQSSTFIEMGEAVLSIAEKYSNQVQWAFKPHPLLRDKLNKYWGKEKTDHYYERWEKAEWSQFESGQYIGLFKHSDAMIHDCGAFTLEYMFTNNPVMYLMKNQELDKNWNSIYKQALKLHCKGWNIDDVETFIQNVIEDIDSVRNDRLGFREKNLVSPYNKTACENIIDCIIDGSREKHMRR